MKLSHPIFMIAPLFIISACAQPAPVEAPENIIDPTTQILASKYADQSFSMADLYEERLDQSLGNTDRRVIDAAMDDALLLAPSAHSISWSSATTDHTGEIDLIRWDNDQRRNETCGTIEHSATLTSDVKGAVVICRSANDVGWRVDEIVWRDVATKEPVKRTTKKGVRRTSSGAAAQPRKPKLSTNQQAVVETPPQTNPNVRPERYTPPPCPQGTGQQTLGDCLAAPK